MIRIDTFDALVELAAESEKLSLGDGSPRKDQKFYLFRGAKECYQLLSSIQVHLSKTKNDPQWKRGISDYERKLLNRFLTEVEPYRQLNHQYHWFCPPCPKTDSFWYLSVMQHFGCPTRLCDFTADFWAAVFFATCGATDGVDVGLYRLKCWNNDLEGNKLPKDCNGSPWLYPEYLNVSDLLGYLIEYGEFPERLRKVDKDRRRFITERLELFKTRSAKSQMFGWDVPFFQNARIRKQRGFFVYGVDLTTPLEDSILEHQSTEFQKYQIAAPLLPEIKSHIAKLDLVEWKIYLDLDRLFKEWRNE